MFNRKRIALLLLGTSVPLALYAADTLFTFESGTVISSSEVNENFDNLDDRILTYESAISVDSTDNFLGVGTTTPLGKLHVANGASNAMPANKFEFRIRIGWNSVDEHSDAQYDVWRYPMGGSGRYRSGHYQL